MQPRPAAPEDIVGVREIAAAHALLTAWPRRPDYLDHELATGLMMVADAPQGGLDGFGASFRRDGVTHLGDLFVQPGREGGGVGRRLLERLLPVAGRRITFSSSDPRALALYVRRGLVPVAPMLHLLGDGSAVSAAAAGYDRLAAVAAGARASEIEVACRGYARPQEHAFLASLAGVELILGEDAFAYLRPAGDGLSVLGPAAGLTAEACRDVVLAAAAASGGPVALALPGAHPALRALLEADFRIVDGDTIMTSPADLCDWARIVPDVDLG